MAWRVEPDRPRRVIRCWACEELLALMSRAGRLIVEADAETTSAGGDPVIICRCGARTMIPDDGEVDGR